MGLRAIYFFLFEGVKREGKAKGEAAKADGRAVCGALLEPTEALTNGGKQKTIFRFRTSRDGRGPQEQAGATKAMNPKSQVCPATGRRRVSKVLREWVLWGASFVGDPSPA